MKILVTGCFGFIGLNFIEFLKNNYPKIEIIGIDNLTYASNTKYLNKFNKIKTFKFYKLNINSKKINEILTKEKPIKIINFAAESHVDNSIISPKNFINSNINGVYNLLHHSANYYKSLDKKLQKKFVFLQVSTDEVYGSLKKGTASESTKYNPSSPYSASKASADHLVSAWTKTFGLPTIITHACNNYGPYQNNEKFIPKIISSIINKSKIPLYGDGKNVREWMYVEDHVKILLSILNKAEKNQTYNIGSNFRMSNIDIIKSIIKNYCKINKVHKEKELINNISYVKDRLGHDERYALNSYKIIKMLKINKFTTFNIGVKKTIISYME